MRQFDEPTDQPVCRLNDEVRTPRCGVAAPVCRPRLVHQSRPRQSDRAVFEPFHRNELRSAEKKTRRLSDKEALL